MNSFKPFVYIITDQHNNILGVADSPETAQRHMDKSTKYGRWHEEDGNFVRYNGDDYDDVQRITQHNLLLDWDKYHVIRKDPC